MQYMSVLGFGLGLSFPALVLASQNAVPFSLMGLTTSLNTFARSVGGTIGVAIMGSILTRRLNDELASGFPATVREQSPPQLLDALRNPRILLDDEALTQIRTLGFDALFGANADALFAQTIDSIKGGLATAITEVFLFAAVLALVSVVISLFLREVPMRRTFEELHVTPGNPAPEPRAAPPQAPSPKPRAGVRPASQPVVHAELPRVVARDERP